MLTWFRRTFGRSTPAAPAPTVAAKAAVSVGVSMAPDTSTSAVTLTSDQTVRPLTISSALTLDERWVSRLAEAEAMRRAHPVAATQADAAALLALLDQEPDAVIRQLPAAARGAIALCDDPSLSRTDLASKLTADPALVQALLRMANSAAVGAGREPVLSIAHALDRIGVVGAQAVILASCVDGMLSRPGGAFDWMASRVWSHMVRTAPIARALAPGFDADADEAFSIALLHDVGKLVVFDRLSVLRSTQRRQLVLDMDFAHQLIQLLHEPLGALAARQWSMGERAVSAIGTHHRSDHAVARDTLAEAVFAAERIDLAQYRSVPVDFDALWTQGQLSGSPARAAAALQRLRDAA